MRIAVSGFLLDGQPSGLGVYSKNVLVELVKHMKNRHQLTIYTPHPEGLSAICSGDVVVQKVPDFLKPKYGANAALARFMWCQTVFPSLLADRHDLLYSPTHHGIIRKGLPQIITIHDLLPIKFPSQYRLQHYYFVHVLPRLIASSTALVVDSQSTRQDVHESYDVPLDKIFVVYSAADRKFTPSQAESLDKVRDKYRLGDFILIVGASYPHKNIIRALEAFAKASSDLQNIQLVVVGGRPDYTDVLKQRAKELGIQEIKFLGYVSPSDLPTLYSAALVLLYPSLYEGFGLPPLEAMACGCPVIVCKTSSLPEVCGDAAYYIDPYDIAGMAEALLVVAKSSDVREGLRQRGLDRVKLFSWEATAQAICRVIESVGRSSTS